MYIRFKVQENKINFVLKNVKAFDCNMYDKKNNIICTLYEKIYTVKFHFILLEILLKQPREGVVWSWHTTKKGTEGAGVSKSL